MTLQPKYTQTSYKTQLDFQGKIILVNLVDKYYAYYLVRFEAKRCITRVKNTKCSVLSSVLAMLLHSSISEPKDALYHDTISVIPFLLCDMTQTCELEYGMAYYLQKHSKIADKKEI